MLDHTALILAPPPHPTAMSVYMETISHPGKVPQNRPFRDKKTAFLSLPKALHMKIYTVPVLQWLGGKKKVCEILEHPLCI